MRRIIVFDRVSADGSFSDAQGGLGWVVPEPALDAEAAGGLRGTGAMLFGRRTYEMFESFWPHAGDEDPHAPGRHTPEIRAMAAWINSAEKVVFSRTRTEVPWRNSRVIPQFDPAVVEELKRGEGNDFMVFGSGSIVTLLARHGLVDEFQLIVTPKLLGSGRRLFGELPADVPLELLDAKTFPEGNVRLRYAPKR